LKYEEGELGENYGFKSDKKKSQRGFAISPPGKTRIK